MDGQNGRQDETDCAPRDSLVDRSRKRAVDFARPQHDMEREAEDDSTESLLPTSSDSTNERRLPPLLRSESLLSLLQSQRVRSAQQAIRRLGHYLAYFTLIGMLILVPTVLYRTLRVRKLDMAAFKSAKIMVVGTVIMSVRLVYLHLTHWYMPDVQKYVVRILWMVPIYATQSYLSLRFHRARIYIDSVRDFYEAYVIASFVYYLMELLGGQDSLVEILRNKAGDTRLGRHVFPLSLILQPWELGLEFALQCKHGVLQYVVFKTIYTLLTFVFESIGVYGEGQFSWFGAYGYLIFFQNLSVMYALYCLVMLYSAVETELRYPINWRPLGKFLCIKGVVFFCWWQSVVIYYLRAHGIIENLGSWSSTEVANGLIDYCVVTEMVGFAIAHSYTFTYKDYLPSNLPQQTESSTAALPESAPSLEPNGDGEQAGPATTYRPPATLPQPMKFKDAFWSSTVPKETIRDIQRLRNGLETALANNNESRPSRTPSIRMQDLSQKDANNSDPPEQTFV